VAGIAVHIASRICDVARSGEVLASSTVRDLVAGSGIGFEPRGTRRLKGVPGSWRVFAAIA
jgi:class 3 adenylate cyclase